MGSYQKFDLDPLYLGEEESNKTFLVNNQIIVDIDKQFLKLPDGQKRTFRKKTAGVLLAFLEQPNTPIASHHFLEKVWSGRIVSENVLKGSIYELRKLLKDEQKSMIVTIPKYGYLLTAQVSCPVNVIKSETKKTIVSRTLTKRTIIILVSLILVSTIAFTLM
ncbi:winged helix-turn-helix domain-containing protein [Aliikangiella coralliicola]|uniref:OmpR/PhoB-type domain-containing protein n=1 Tax=Aliikangiella coralliicola TaxID=2592383 RepID=A0A545UC56_9GAMM|nr:winged helix-turn-helix domain-containing protein [Aliikangiella coralliicola]TQV87013.1 hypothetical protein FLL46_14495 [Aliikangiella coralliicola]